jgi:hypothetical protein
MVLLTKRIYELCRFEDLRCHDIHNKFYIIRSKILWRWYINIITCRVVRATKMTGSSSDDWIY